jgi:hypothetical protein
MACTMQKGARHRRAPSETERHSLFLFGDDPSRVACFGQLFSRELLEPTVSYCTALAKLCAVDSPISLTSKISVYTYSAEYKDVR